MLNYFYMAVFDCSIVLLLVCLS